MSLHLQRLQAAESRLREVERERDEARSAISLDRTGLGKALVDIRTLAEGYGWLAEPGVWGSYGWKDHKEETLRREIGQCFDRLMAIATQALRDSGALADASIHGALPLFPSPDEQAMKRLTQERDEARIEAEAWKAMAEAGALIVEGASSGLDLTRKLLAERTKERDDAMASASAPMRSESNGEAGDSSLFCEGCGNEVGEPHRWEQCMMALRPIVDAHHDAITDSMVAALRESQPCERAEHLINAYERRAREALSCSVSDPRMMVRVLEDIIVGGADACSKEHPCRACEVTEVLRDLWQKAESEGVNCPYCGTRNCGNECKLGKWVGGDR